MKIDQRPLFDEEPPAVEVVQDTVVETLVRQHIRRRRHNLETRKKKALRPKFTQEQMFDKFHAKNPKVLVRLTEMAIALKKSGVPHYGIKALYEVLRYEQLTTVVVDGEPFKLNNNYTAYYAREIERQTPELVGFFRMRTTRS